MPKQRSNKDYSKYTFDDFLNDGFFISSIKESNEEKLSFWNNLIENNEINIQEFNSAKTFLQSIDKTHNTLSENEITTLWKDINISNKRLSKNNSFKKRLYISVSVAASIILLIIALPYFINNQSGSSSETNDLMQYAQQTQMIEGGQSEVQLIMSDENTILLQEKESDIIYDSTEIKISEKEISKKGSDSFNQLIVPKGKRSKLTLADGTKMYVNAGTRVVYPIEFKNDRREIYVDGEIFIEVSPDAKRPFIVRTGSFDVQVLGTKFNVMAYESDANKQIVLASGAVKIVSKNNTEDVALSPAQMYAYNNGQGHLEKKVDVAKYTSWIKGFYYFESERLDIILARLSRYYGTDIHFSQDIAHLRCSGKLDLKENLTDVLNGLTYTLPIKVEYNNQKYNLTKTH